MKNVVLGTFLFSFIVALSCSPSQDTSVTKDDFNRGALLTNMADHIIIPAFEDLNSKLNDLSSDKDAFITNVNQSNLEAFRVSWLEAYKTWQHVEMFNIGKAEEILYAFQMNVYPVTVVDIERNIETGNYDLGSVNNNDAVGFSALDYMLYGVADSDTSILEKYSDIKYKNYLSDLVDRMQVLTQTVLNDWKTSYRPTFISSTSNTATSALNKLVNDFIFYYEKGLRANKFGIPAGNFSRTPLPDKVEAYYSKDFTKELAIEALNAVQDVFNGKAYNNSLEAESLKTYLQFLNREDLATTINSRFDVSRQKIQLLKDNLFVQINTDNSKMTEVFDAIQLGVINLKADMLQAFCVSVDFVDADGD